MASFTKEQAVEFLQQESLLSLATVSADGKPQVADVYFVVDADLNIYFATRADSAKWTNALSPAGVAGVVTSQEQPVTVQFQGAVQEASMGDTIKPVIEKLITATQTGELTKRWLPPVKQMKHGGLVIGKITPTWLRVGDFRDEHDNPEDCFQQIIG